MSNAVSLLRTWGILNMMQLSWGIPSSLFLLVSHALSLSFFSLCKFPKMQQSVVLSSLPQCYALFRAPRLILWCNQLKMTDYTSMSFAKLHPEAICHKTHSGGKVITSSCRDVSLSSGDLTDLIIQRQKLFNWLEASVQETNGAKLFFISGQF